MLLPQSEAFHTLRQRLQCIPSQHVCCENQAKYVRNFPKDFDQLLHFLFGLLF